MSAYRLCKGDDYKELIFEVVQISTQEDVVFCMKLSLADMKANNFYFSQSSDELSFSKLALLEFVETLKPSFLDYVHSGAELTMIYGVDFSSEQGHEGIESNRFLSKITDFQSILQNYSLDQIFFAFGLGACFTSLNRPSNFFSFTGNIFQPGIINCAMLLEYYKSIVSQISECSKPIYSDLFHNIYKQVLFENTDNSRYFVLTILCGQDTIDEIDMKISLLKLENLPISVLILGLVPEVSEYHKIKTLIEEINRLSKRSFITFSMTDGYLSLIEKLSAQALEYFMKKNVTLKEKADITKSLRSQNASTKKISERLSSRNTFYTKCRQDFIVKLKDKGYSQEKIDEIMFQGAPFFEEDIDNAFMMRSLYNRSKSVKLTKNKVSITICPACTMAVKKLVDLKCGCEMVCSDCSKRHKCVKNGV